MRSSSVEEVGGHGPGDPWEVFTALAILVVEGRTPGGERGYHAGPHCPLPHQLQHKHSCDPNDHTCIQAGALVRQLRVMWGVGVGVSLEVLVAPECQHGAALAATLDTTIAPSQNLRLIEQWNFTIYDRRLPEATATGWSLVAAVRSFLHFSQLSAWLSVSGGRRPPNVLYRLTVTSPVFCSKFTEEAEEHVFPLAYMGQDTSIKVAVRSLPRSEKVPVAVCQEPHEEEIENVPSEDSLPTCSQNKADMARCEEDLRRSVMKARLAENSRVSRSESPDTQLGESLLDPPNSLARFPRRYQSPSRSGSPSLETPEHLICRHRHPVPPNSRPPDVAAMLGPSATRHPFSWTQARYPLPPLNLHPTSMASASSSSSTSLLPDHHHHHHHPSYHLQQQSPYRIDYSEAGTPYQRPPQLVYSRPQACPSQTQQHVQQQQKSEHLHPSQHNLQMDSFDPYQKQYGRLSPRGGKYQNYPEYQYSESAERHGDQISTGEYSEPPKKCRGQRALSGEYSEFDKFSRLRMKLDHQDSSTSSTGHQSTSSCSRRVPARQEEEYQSEWEHKKNHHNGSKKHNSQAPVDTEAYQADNRKVGSKAGTRTKRPSNECEEKKCRAEEHSKLIDDQLRPCCSHTGKHLCSSMEDLSEVCDKEVSSCSRHPKELKHKGEVSPSHLFHNKFNFDLTPKETMEILSVLRHSSSMRIDSPRNDSKVSPTPRSRAEKKLLHLGVESELKPEKSSWINREIDKKLLKDGGRKLENTFWREGSDEMVKSLGRGECIGNLESEKCGADRMGPNAPPLSFGCSVRDNERCQSGYSGRGNVRESQATTSSPENQFLEAIALTGEKHCDISNCKMVFDSREPYRTGVCSDSACHKDSEIMKDKTIQEGFREDGQLQQQQQEQQQQQCVEAKKITHKTSFYTACSEPAKAIHCQPQKQVSHTLSKSPFSAILSSIQNEYNRDEETHLLSRVGTAQDKAREKVKRVLDFQEETPENDFSLSRENQKALGSNRLKTHAEQKDWKIAREGNGECVVRVRETREGFRKDASLLKQLMTRSHPPQSPQETSQDEGDELLDSSLSRPEDDNREAQKENWERENQDAEMQLDDMNSEDDEVEKYCNGRGVAIPSASEKAQFRRSLDSATNMVFHSKTGLPLTSSPAPLRKGKRFDYDSTLNTVAAIKRSTSFHCSALYTCDTEEEEAYNLEMHAACTAHKAARKSSQLSASAPATVTCSNLLGSFEECVLNGRLEPVSTVQGFTAEIAASGAFCPKRTTKPVTVFFYTLCDNDQISSPYMGHINLSKKGYHVPNKGTIQVTLFNPHGTVVKMFVVMYDLSDMPPNSRTFVRQRTLNMPVGASDVDVNAHQWLRYLIHLRFASSKSGKIYLHSDIRMLILRKSDADAATLHKTNVPYELRSFTHGPTNPKFSPRK